ncbi:MAG: cupin domain-containing protein [Haloechinothrix sp.]
MSRRMPPERPGFVHRGAPFGKETRHGHSSRRDRGRNLPDLHGVHGRNVAGRIQRQPVPGAWRRTAAVPLWIPELFGSVSAAVQRVLQVRELRWISFGHVEADECGSMNHWLDAAPHAQVMQGVLGCDLSVRDMADRAPRQLADGEVLDLGGKRIRLLDTPHVPHNWEAIVLYEETTRTLLCGDLFTHVGDGPALVERDQTARCRHDVAEATREDVDHHQGGTEERDRDGGEPRCAAGTTSAHSSPGDVTPKGRKDMEPYSLKPDEGEAIWMFDSLDTIKAAASHTDGTFSLFEFRDFEGSTVPMHVHERCDQGFYILEGRYTFFISEGTVAAPVGCWVFVPRGTAHSWRCESSLGRCLSLVVPSGLEDFYRNVGEAVTDQRHPPPRREPDGDALAQVAARFGITVTGPPPLAGQTPG